jgi:cytochrome c oxidase subunit 3
VSNPHSHAERSPYVAHHFESAEQQKESSTLGMWLFLAQEFMFFGGLFLAYAVYRYSYPDAWAAGSHALPVLPGAINTIILLLSSFSMAMGVYYAQTSQQRKLFWALVSTMVLGIAFVVIKWFWEYSPKIAYGAFPGASFGPDAHHYPELAAFADQGPLQLFFIFYFIMTGMHALHMIIGFGIILWLMVGTLQGKYHSERYMHIENFGLYWHFVDIVWVFLFPMFYLVHSVSGGH